MYAITWINMIDQRMWVGHSQGPTTRQSGAETWETAAQARQVLRHLKSLGGFGVLFDKGAYVVEVPFVDECQEEAERVSQKMFASWPEKTA